MINYKDAKDIELLLKPRTEAQKKAEIKRRSKRSHAIRKQNVRAARL